MKTLLATISVLAAERWLEVFVIKKQPGATRIRQRIKATRLHVGCKAAHEGMNGPGFTWCLTSLSQVKPASVGPGVRCCAFLLDQRRAGH